MSYKHLSRDERVKLAALLNAGLDQATIAKQLNRHQSTISRELSRGAVESVSGYYLIAATKRKEAKRIKANYRFRKIDNNIQLGRYVSEKLKLYWSPQQIAGRLKLEFGFTVLCHETIYQYIYKQRPELKKFLRTRKWQTQAKSRHRGPFKAPGRE